MLVCKDVEEWIQEEIEKKIERQEKRCKKWPWPLSWLCSLVTFLVKILVKVWKKVVRVVCEVIVFAWNLVTRVINFILLIPLIGPIIRAVLRAFATVISYVIGVFDGLGRLIGIRTTKHLRLHMVPLCRDNAPLAREANLRAIMEQTARSLYDRAQIRVHWTFQEPIRQPPRQMLRIGTEGDMIADIVWAKGSWYQAQVDKHFQTSANRLFGWGAPIVVFVIEEVGYNGVGLQVDATGAYVQPGGVVGVSGGPFVDWVAVEATSVVDQLVPGTLTPFPPTVASGSPAPTGVPNPAYTDHGRFVVAHEVCHTLGLMGHANSQPGDLMYDNTLTGDALSPFQVGIIRNSSRVTFF